MSTARQRASPGELIHVIREPLTSALDDRPRSGRLSPTWAFVMERVTRIELALSLGKLMFCH